MRRTTLVLLMLSLLPALSLADVTYEEETKMGGLMKVMSMGKATKSTTRVSGSFMRTDQDNNATIIDLEGEKILTLDTKKKTYSVMTFEEMKKKMEQAVSALSGKGAEASKAKEGETASESTDVSASTDVRVTETGRTETIQGLECKQYLLELNLTLESQKEQQSGTMSTVTEMWMAKDVPGSEELSAFHRRMAEKMGTMSVGQRFAPGMGQGQNQGFSADMQKMADEMKKMEGHAMRSIMYFGSAEAAKAEATAEKKPEAKEEGGGGGGLGAFLKKMQNPGGGDSGSSGGVMMKITTETKKIDTNPIDPKVFAVPADYKLVEAK